MVTNMALKRAAKANRRKMIVAEKRKAEAAAGTLSEQVRGFAGSPLQACLLSEGLWECGAAMLILARGVTVDQFGVGVFVLDSYCTGIKEAAFMRIEGLEFADMVDRLALRLPLEPVDPSYARKLMRDLAAWADEIGFASARDYPAVERLFGDINADACETSFQFGREGKPFYVQGLTDSPGEVLRRLEMVRNYNRRSAACESDIPISFIPVKAA